MKRPARRLVNSGSRFESESVRARSGLRYTCNLVTGSVVASDQPRTKLDVGGPSPSTIAAREEELGSHLERFGPRHEELEGIGQPVDRIECEADCERILDLLARNAGG